MAVERLIADALTLTVEDRERLLSALLNSLDGSSLTREQWEAAWIARRGTPIPRDP